ncbi:MAG: CvpA family protein [Bacilli bacterium]|nr:CvpA family protein [Bacilli bacterium]
MSIVDILIIIFILAGGLIGFKQGFTQSLINFIGVILVIIFSFLFKNVLSLIFMKIFPFFPFGGLIKGVTVLNIALYEFLAFFFVFSILMIILKVISKTTKVFESVLAFTIILGIPSKILGMIVGIIKNYIIVFFVMYFLALPSFSSVSVVNNSKFREPILKNTPLLSIVAGDAVKVLDEFEDLSLKYKNTSDSNEFNLETLDLFLKYRITTVETVNSLIDSGKIRIKGVDKVLEKYENS